MPRWRLRPGFLWKPEPRRGFLRKVSYDETPDCSYPDGQPPLDGFARVHGKESLVQDGNENHVARRNNDHQDRTRSEKDRRQPAPSLVSYSSADRAIRPV